MAHWHTLIDTSLVHKLSVNKIVLQRSIKINLANLRPYATAKHQSCYNFEWGNYVIVVYPSCYEKGSYKEIIIKYRP